jgi:hypothetical protein
MGTVSLPNTLANNTTADATQVMANFNAIVSKVNGGLGDANMDSTDPLDADKIGDHYVKNNADDSTSGSITVSTNNKGFKGTTTEAEAVSLAKVNSSDQVELGDAGREMVLKGSGAAPQYVKGETTYNIMLDETELPMMLKMMHATIVPEDGIDVSNGNAYSPPGNTLAIPAMGTTFKLWAIQWNRLGTGLGGGYFKVQVLKVKLLSTETIWESSAADGGYAKATDLSTPLATKDFQPDFSICVQLMNSSGGALETSNHGSIQIAYTIE